MRRATVLWLAYCGIHACMAADLDLQGHRGARGLKPENTLAAFAEALSLGVSTLEMDVGLSKDDVVVVSHDPRLNPDITRGPDGEWVRAPGPALRELTWAEIQRYDVGRIRPGTDYARRFPYQQPVDGARIPALSEVFALTERAGNRSVRFNIETKLSPLEPGAAAQPAFFAQRLIEALRAAGVARRASIQSFDWRTLQHVQAVAPEIVTVYLTAQQSWQDNLRRGQPGPSPWTAGFDVDDYGGSIPRLIEAAGGGVWSPYFRELTAAALAEARARGLRVIVWTVNDGAEMRRLMDLGVDGMITDYPDRLRAVMREAGMTLPTATPVR